MEVETEAIVKLKELYPFGHEGFIPLLVDAAKLHSEKNYGYAFGGDPLGNFNRVSEIKKLYPKMDWAQPIGVCLGYALKQVDASLWQLQGGYEDSKEGVANRLKDVFVYTGIAMLLLEEMKKNAIHSPVSQKQI